MKYKLTVILLLFCSVACMAQLTDEDLPQGTRLVDPKEAVNNGWLKEKMQLLNEKAHSELTGGISMSPRQYEDTIRAFFRADRWEAAYPFLQAAEREWGDNAVICCLIGRYWFHRGSIDVARWYLIRSINEDISSTEALETLVKLEEQEKNYATAIVHLNDLLSWSPYNKRLWRKKIELYRLQGNDVEADRLLYRLQVIYPNDEEIRNDVIYRKEIHYLELSKGGNDKESQLALQDLIVQNPKEPEYYLALASSFVKEGKTDDALAVCAKGVNNTGGNRLLIRKRVAILMDAARYQEAEQYLDECIRRYRAMGLTELRDYLREQAAYAADAADAYTRHKNWYARTGSDEALEWLIRASMQRTWWGEAQYYLAEDQALHGVSKPLLLRRYEVEKQLGNDRTAAKLLEELFQMDRQDADICELIAEKRLREGTDLMQDEMWAQALQPLMQADSLTNDSDMHVVLSRRITTCLANIPDTTVVKDSLDWMQHSVLYEKEHNLDSAYATLMRYRPSLDEYHYVQRHRYTLQSRLMKNALTFEYQYARRTSIDEWSHNAYLTYSRRFKQDAFDVSAVYAARESATWTETLDPPSGKDTTYTSEGGTGVQIGAAYYHYFTWGDISVQGAWSSKFLPKAVVKIASSQNLPMEWAISERLQWRYITDNTPYHVFSLGASASWSSHNGFVLTPSIDAFLMQGKVYANGGFKMVYLPLEGDRSNVFASVSVGNAPDLDLLDSNLPVRFNHLNTGVGVGGFYLINGHIGISGSVDWYVMGNNNNTVRNYIYIHVGVGIFF